MQRSANPIRNTRRYFLWSTVSIHELREKLQTRGQLHRVLSVVPEKIRNIHRGRFHQQERHKGLKVGRRANSTWLFSYFRSTIQLQPNLGFWKDPAASSIPKLLGSSMGVSFIRLTIYDSKVQIDPSPYKFVASISEDNLNCSNQKDDVPLRCRSRSMMCCSTIIRAPHSVVSRKLYQYYSKYQVLLEVLP